MKWNRLKKSVLFSLAVGVAAYAPLQMVKAEAAEKALPRTIVTTDGEIDDMDSFLRFLLYTNEMDVEGLVYSSSQWHYKGDGKGTTCTSAIKLTRDLYGARTDLRWCGTDWIQGYLEKYRAVYPNLIKHDARYPSPDKLASLVKIGNIDFEGEMSQDTDGSNHIKQVLLDDKEGPVYMQVWGGTNTIARALKSIEEQYKGTDAWQRIYDKVSKKAVIYAILDQDATYKEYIAKSWPDIRVVYNAKQFASFCPGYVGMKYVPKPLQKYFQGSWLKPNIIQGPLLSEYMTWGDGRKLAGDPEDVFGDMAAAQKKGFAQYDLISEGDTPSFLYLVNNGLRSVENPANGGWGGRFVQSQTDKNRWEDGPTVADYNPYTKEKMDNVYPQIRWVDAIQNDFAARVQWTMKDYAQANHAPEVAVEGSLDLTAKAGQTITIKGLAKDPDGDKLSYKWWQYQEAGTYAGKVQIKHADRKDLTVTLPQDVKAGETIHLIFEVKDAGTPPLTRYAHVIVTVE